jgi:hypothetical protein
MWLCFMKVMARNSSLILLLIILASCPANAQTKNDYFSHLQLKHKAVLKKWLGKRAWLRPATEDDCSDKGNLAYIRRELGTNVHPYYSVADFNHDGRKDFAVLLVVKGKDEMALAVFNAPFVRSKPAYFERGFEKMGNMYIAFNYPVKSHLYLGVFESDYYCMTLIPKGRKYTYEDCEH